MGNLRFLLVIAVFCVVFGNALSQNRGSVRYGAGSNDDSDEESTRSQRPAPPPRSVRRRRPTSAPEPPSAEDDVQSHSQESTTGRRVPDRTNTPRFGSQTSSVSHSIEEPAAPLLPGVTYDLPVAPPAIPEDKSEGRRRRPKKRRRPQGAKDSEKKEIDIPDTRKEGIESVNTEPKPSRPYHSDSALRNNQNAYDSSGLTDKPQWSSGNFGDSVEDPGRRNAGAQYFPPQSGTNRLPVETSDENENSRKYSETPQSAPKSEVSNRRYVPAEPAPNRGSYVPVLSPIRVPTEGHEQYPRSREATRTRQDRPSDSHHQRRTPGNRSPVSVPQEVTRSSDAKSHQNENLRNSQPSHSEVRLPQAELPHISRQYDRGYNEQPEYGNSEGHLGGLREDGKLSENDNGQRAPQATNRLPNPSEDVYNPIYPYLDENLSNEQVSHTTVPHRREEASLHVPGDAIIPYSNLIPKDTVEPSKSITDVEDEKQKLSRYEPPLQRSRASSQPRNPGQSKEEAPTRNLDSSRSRSQSRSETSRNRVSSNDKPEIVAETPTRQRGSSRYQPDSSVDKPTRTRDSTRYAADSALDSLTRTRGSTRNQPDISDDQPTRTRGSNRYTTDASLDAISRTRDSTRNQPDPSPDAITRTRSSTRRQPDSPVDASTPTRGSSRYQQDSSIDRPTRTRSSQEEVPSSPQRHRNTQRYPTDANGDSRLSSRRQLPNPEVHPNPELDPDYQTYSQTVPERREPNEEAAPSPYSRYAHPTNKPDVRDAADPVRNTLRSRPQYETREPVQPYLYEESSDDEEDPNLYVPEYQPPQEELRNQRTPSPTPPREEPRQQSGRENAGHRTSPRQQQQDQRTPQSTTRRQPQSQYHQTPQNDRSQARPRQQTRSRPESSAPAPSHGRSSGGSKFSCPEPYGFFADHVQCDKYYECRNGTAIDGLCEDGLAFNLATAPKYLRCDSIRDVECNSRPELQEPRPTKNCPRRYGLFPNEGDCTKFFNCVDGSATEVQCPPGLTFNDDRATCDWADLVKSSCKTEDLLGFTCPEPSAYDLQDGVYTSYPHPDNCQLHFVCIKGENGERQPRMLACNEGLVYSPQSAACARPDDVPGCEDFYGSRSPAPKRKPSREPLPAEPESLEEEPKPARRRVVQQNRRIRN